MDTEEKREISVLVLTHGDFQIYRGAYCYMVITTKVSESSGERYHLKNSYTFHRTLADAISELSKRMYICKLRSRAKAKLDDFESLVRLTEEHKAEVDRIFGSL